MWKSLQKKLAIDLGSYKIKMIVLNEPLLDGGALSQNAFREQIIEDYACVARKKNSGKIIAIGKDALEMQGRLEKEVDIIFPFQASQIMDLKAAKFLLQALLQRSLKGVFLSPVLMLTTVSELSPLGRESLSQFFYDLGFAEVYLMAQPLAAAIGAGVPVAISSGVLFFQLGASQKEASIIALGSVLEKESNSFAGVALAAEIVHFLEENYQIRISREEANRLLKEVASINRKDFGQRTLIAKSLETGAPLETIIDSAMIMPVMQAFAQDCEETVKILLKKVSPELLGDILDKGMLLAGALAETDGLEAYLIQQLGIPVALVDHATEVVLQGAVYMLASLDEYRSSLAFSV